MAINLCADHFSEWYDGGMPCDYCKQQKRTAELEAENEDWSQKWTESEIENQRLEQLFLNEERLREATTEEKDAEIAELKADNQRLREAHKRNLKEDAHRSLIRRNHLCPWRQRLEAVVERSKAALQGEGEG